MVELLKFKQSFLWLLWSNIPKEIVMHSIGLKDLRELTKMLQKDRTFKYKMRKTRVEKTSSMCFRRPISRTLNISRRYWAEETPMRTLKASGTVTIPL